MPRNVVVPQRRCLVQIFTLSEAATIVLIHGAPNRVTVVAISPDKLKNLRGRYGSAGSKDNRCCLGGDGYPGWDAFNGAAYRAGTSPSR